MPSRRVLLAWAAVAPIVATRHAAVSRAMSNAPATPETAAPIAEVLWQADGGPDFRLESPAGVAIDPEGRVWVADGATARFVIFSPEGEVLETWGTPGDGEGAFNFVCPPHIAFGALAFDEAGNIYVVDSGNHRVQKFAPDRTFVTSWGSTGFADDQFLCPAALAVDTQGRVFVTDEGWAKIKVFTDDGEWLATWPDAATPIGIAADRDGNVWVADYGKGNVLSFSPEGERRKTWEETARESMSSKGPINVAVDTEGRVFVTELDGHQVQVFAPDGALLGAWGGPGKGAGQLTGPFGIALDGNGAAYVTDTAHGVQKFQLLPSYATPTT